MTEIKKKEKANVMKYMRKTGFLSRSCQCSTVDKISKESIFRIWSLCTWK